MGLEPGNSADDRREADLPTASELQSAAIRGSLWTALATAIGIPITLAGTIATARLLGPGRFGGFASLMFVFPLLVSALDFGMGTATAWQISASSLIDRGRVESAVSRYSTWSLLKLPVLAGAGLLLFGIHPVELATYVLVSAGFLYMSVVQLTLSAERQFKSGSLLNLLGTTASMGAMVGAAAATHDYRIVFLSRLAGQAVALPALMKALGRPLVRASLRPKRPTLPTGMRLYAFAGWAAYLTSVWVFGRSEILFLGAANHKVDQGRFGAATTVSARATLLSDALYTSLDASVVALQSAHADVVERAFRRVARFGCIVGVVTAMAVVPLAVLLAPLLFGGDYGNLSTSIALLTAASIVWTSISPINSWLTANRNVKGMVLPGLIAATADAGLSAVLCPAFGLTGAVAANLASTLIIITALIAIGLESRAQRIEVLRCSAYVVLIAGLISTTSVLAARFEPLISLVLAYPVALALTYGVLRLLPPIAAEEDVRALTNAVPARVRPVIYRLLAPVSLGRV